MLIVKVRMYGLLEVNRGIASLRRTLRHESSAVLGRRLAEEAKRIVTKLTPRQMHKQRFSQFPKTKRGFPPFFKEWDIIDRITRASHYQATVYNRATKTDAGERALGAVEHGSPPHTFGPKNAKALAWFQPRAQRLFSFRHSDLTRPRRQRGLNVISDRYHLRRQRAGIIFAKKVRHPGNAPFRMVRETKLHIRQVADKFLARHAREIARSFAGLQIGVS